MEVNLLQQSDLASFAVHDRTFIAFSGSRIMRLMPWSFALRGSLKSSSVTFLEAFKLLSLRVGKRFETEKNPGIRYLVASLITGGKKKEIRDTVPNPCLAPSHFYIMDVHNALSKCRTQLFFNM